jgi:hypothetical protein
METGAIILTVSKGSTPKWLLDKGLNSVAAGSDIFPDHHDPVFLDYNERLVKGQAPIAWSQPGEALPTS